MSLRVRIRRPGGYERLELEEVAPRPPGEGEVRIAVDHAGVNYADCVVRMGLYEAARRKVGWPITPGFEVCGRVAETGPGVQRLRPGDRVIGVTLFDGYSASLTLPAEQVFHAPDCLDSAQAAAVPVAFLTAHFALHELAGLRAGEHVLVHSAAGGVGSAAVQLARRAGARVTAVVGAPHKVAVARAQGAQLVIDKSSQPLWDAAESAAPEGFDVILDANGPPTLADSYAHLAPLGRLVVYGFHGLLPRRGGRPNWLALAAGVLRMPRFNPMRLTVENRSVMGFNLAFLEARRDRLAAAMASLLDGFVAGALKPPPVTEYPVTRVADAHRDLESGRTTGKLVLRFAG